MVVSLAREAEQAFLTRWQQQGLPLHTHNNMTDARFAAPTAAPLQTASGSSSPEPSPSLSNEGSSDDDFGQPASPASRRLAASTAQSGRASRASRQ